MTKGRASQADPQPETPPVEPVEPTPPAEPVGGPGIPAIPADLRTVKIGGREFQAPPDMAEALAQRERDYEAGIQRQGEELGALRARQREWEAQQQRLAQAGLTAQPAAPPRRDIATELFTDPEAALARHRKEIISELQSERQTERNREEFWGGFYKAHPDLSRDDHWVVENVLQRHFNALSNLSVEDGQKKLGELTRTTILGLLRKGTNGHAGTPRTTVEGGANARPERSTAPRDDDGPGKGSLSDAITARRRQKRGMAPATR